MGTEGLPVVVSIPEQGGVAFVRDYVVHQFRGCAAFGAVWVLTKEPGAGLLPWPVISALVRVGAPGIGSTATITLERP